jgi:hypothetical protein
MREKFYRWLAWHLPRDVAYWATIRLGAYATAGPWRNQVVPNLTLMETLKRWESDKWLS